jgi:molecular chaperone GrpE
MSVDVNTKPSDEASDDAVETLRQERNELQDRLLRTAAEFDNYRKRTERERRELSEAVSADLIRDVLPVVDDLERALAAAADSKDEALRSGVELIHRQLLEAMRRRGVEPFESVGQQFDPAWHEALASEPAAGREDGEIVGEIRRGYRIGTRLIRPALVRVAKA